LPVLRMPEAARRKPNQMLRRAADNALPTAG
jgi:hypothetical protein